MKESTLARIQYYGGLLLARPLFGFSVSGTEKVPKKGGLIIACNHISDMDPPILGFAIPRTAAFMAKIELFRSRFGKFVMDELKAFPVNRSGVDTGAVRRAVDHLRHGMAVVIYPEGTRSRNGRMLPGKAGISLIAAVSGAPVQPAFIWGTDHPMKAFLRKDEPFSVTFGEPIPSGRLAEIRRESGAQAVADEVMKAIEMTGIDAGHYRSNADMKETSAETGTSGKETK